MAINIPKSLKSSRKQRDSDGKVNTTAEMINARRSIVGEKSCGSIKI